jgi:hypothetical protein
MKRLTLCLALSAAMPTTMAVAQDPRGVAYSAPAPFAMTVRERVRPQVDALLDALIVDGRAYRLDGVEVFAAEDKFLPGKIAIALSHSIVATPPDDPAFERRLAGFRKLSELTLDDANETWGIYYYLSALTELDQHDLLERAVAPEVLERLKQKLDWRTFVRPDLTLIDLPNNYYGVAFSVARLRHGLGWEDASAGDALLARTLEHYRLYSGAFGFADETDGQGRFDRYSVLLIGEIAQRLIQSGIEPSDDVRAWLRSSVEVLLPRMNLRGEGFEYGRSIGVYGDTAFLEVLSAAAALGLLSPEEMEMAYAFSSRVAARYADFWLDSGTGSVNLWDHGRKTDAYRGKHRILGENLSLSHQLIYTSAIWDRLGWGGRETTPDFAAWLEILPRSTTTWFSRGETDRLLVTYRDGHRVIGLPVINGGPGQHMNTPYFPVPFSPGVLAGSADETYPFLLPTLTLADGTRLAPLTWFTDAAVTEAGEPTVVGWRQSLTDRLGENTPVADDRAAYVTRYELAPGRISRTDEITLAEGTGPATVALEFPIFSMGARATARGIVFEAGEVAAFEVEGMGCEASSANGDAYRSPVGAFRTVVRCEGRIEGSARVGWTIRFR